MTKSRWSLLIIALATVASKVTAEQCQPDAQKWQDSVCCKPRCPKNWKSFPVLLVSFDGFWYKYLPRNATPSFDVLKRCGSSPPYMFPSFPSKTFPNFYTIVTGLYPESHGIIDNTMYDPTFPDPKDWVFNINPTGKTNPWFLGEPIWNTATKQHLKSAILSRMGADVIINGMQPTYHKTYTENDSLDDQVKQIMEWLQKSDEERPSLVLAYFNDPDDAGHYFGPYSKQLNQTLVGIERLVNKLMSDLFSAGLLHCVNLIVTSDHGMKQLAPSRGYIDDYVDPTGMVVFTGPVPRIMLGSSPLKVEEVEKKLNCKEQWFRTYRREDIPKRYHYSRISRIGDIILDLDSGRIISQKDKEYYPGMPGDHGYDNLIHSMRTIFIAEGPSFKKNYKTVPFQNIQIYNLFADLMGLTDRAPNNGTEGALYDILVTPPREIVQPDLPMTDRCESSNFKSCDPCQLPEIPTSQKALLTAVALTQQAECRLCAMSDADFSLLFNEKTNMANVLQTLHRPDLDIAAGAASKCCAISAQRWNCDEYSAAIRELEAADMGLYSLLSSTSTAGDNWESFYSRVPMYNEFHRQVWSVMVQLLKKVTSGRPNKVLTFMGPIFDYNFDGLADDISLIRSKTTGKFFIPTHYFFVSIECSDGWQSDMTCQGEAKTQNFIFPHKNGMPCHAAFEDFARAHVACIKDVELLTGFSFLPKWKADKAIKLKIDLTGSIRTAFQWDE